MTYQRKEQIGDANDSIDSMRAKIERLRFALSSEEWRHEPELVEENVELRDRLNRLAERLKELTDMRLEWVGEFQRGQADGWNQCLAQVRALIKEAQGGD